MRGKADTMKNLLLLAVLAYAGWYAYAQYQQRSHVRVEAVTEVASARKQAPARDYKCDGRIHCSQMTSCAEATFFLQHCPGTKMDGNNDGIPCERQWCN